MTNLDVVDLCREHGLAVNNYWWEGLLNRRWYVRVKLDPPPKLIHNPDSSWLFRTLVAFDREGLLMEINRVKQEDALLRLGDEP